MKKTLMFAMALITSVAVAGMAYSDDKDKHKGHDHSKHDHGHDHDQQMAPVAVNDHHKVLHHGVGEWKIEQKHWHQPGAEPMMAYGKTICKKILDGQGTAFSVETTGDMGTFKGYGMATWNTITKKYSCTWVDIFSYNGIDPLEGTWDATTKTMTWSAKMTMPDGKTMPYKMIEQHVSKDKMVAKFMWHDPATGNEFLGMQNTYTRIK